MDAHRTTHLPCQARERACRYAVKEQGRCWQKHKQGQLGQLLLLLLLLLNV